MTSPRGSRSRSLPTLVLVEPLHAHGQTLNQRKISGPDIHSDQGFLLRGRVLNSRPLGYELRRRGPREVIFAGHRPCEIAQGSLGSPQSGKSWAIVQRPWLSPRPISALRSFLMISSLGPGLRRGSRRG